MYYPLFLGGFLNLSVLNIGIKISDLRKEQGLSRDTPGKKVGTSGAVIGRYEWKEITPSIEVAAKFADALQVPLDYLTGGTSFIVKDKNMLYRLELLQKMKKKEKGHHTPCNGFSLTNRSTNYATKINVIMNLQYSSDSTGKITGVFIPISEWNELKSKYKVLAKNKSTSPFGR